MIKNNLDTQYVTACFYGFDNISKKLIFSRLKDPKYAIELMEEPQEADVCLYNQESDEDMAEIKTLKEQLKEASIPMILLTDAQDLQDEPYLRVITKPYKNRELSKYLYLVKDVFYAVLAERLRIKNQKKPEKQIYNRHLSNAINPAQIQYGSDRYYAQKYVGINPDVDFSDSSQVKKVQFNVNNYFFKYLKDAYDLSKLKKKTACIKTVYGVFYVDATTKLIYHKKTAEEIINIHKIPFYKDSKVFLPKLKRGELQKLHQFDYEPFVWLSSINASKGKIPDDSNFSTPVKLTAWPDLTKLVVFKHAIRIISLWSRGVYSLQHTGKLLNIPQRYPLTVYTALNALGLVTQVKKR